MACRELGLFRGFWLCWALYLSLPTTGTYAVLPTTPILLTRNPSFESPGGGVGSFAGWEVHGNWGIGPNPQVVPNNLPEGGRSRFDSLAGNHQLRLRGQGGIGQIITLADDVERVLLNALAYSRQEDGNPPGPNRILPRLQVNFYDAGWNEIQTRDLQIGGFDGRQASGLNPYSLGLDVPVEARFALLVVFNFDQAMEALVDNFGLYDVTDRTPTTGLRNLVFNTPLMEHFGSSMTGESYFLLGNEFWYTKLQLTDHPGGLTRWGTTRDSEYAWQPVEVVEGRQYEISVTGEPFAPVVPQVGLDFYGLANGRIFTLARRQFEVTQAPTVTQTFTPPEGTEYTVANFFVPQLTGNEDSHGVLAPTIILKDLGPTN